MFLRLWQFLCKHWLVVGGFVVTFEVAAGLIGLIVWLFLHSALQTPPKSPGSVVSDPAVETPPETPGSVAVSQKKPAAVVARGQQLAALPKGNIVLHAPVTMKVTERRRVDVNVGINAQIEVLKKQIPSSDQTFEGTLRVSASMAATLAGAGFKIEPVTPEEQPIAEGFPTVWSWYIEAKVLGDQELVATLYAIVGTERLRVDSYIQKITVNVIEKSWGEWLQALSHEIDAVKAIAMTVGGVVAAGLGWFGITLSRRKKKSPPKRKPKPATANAAAGTRADPASPAQLRGFERRANAENS
jgi:hypothetical protein